MFTDIVGYTKLMGQNEELAMRAVEVQRDVMTPIIEKYDGILIKEIGDGTLTTFHSTIN